MLYLQQQLAFTNVRTKERQMGYFVLKHSYNRGMRVFSTITVNPCYKDLIEAKDVSQIYKYAKISRGREYENILIAGVNLNLLNATAEMYFLEMYAELKDLIDWST
jgi:hypothetical protein